MTGAYRSASRPAATAGPSRARVQPMSVFYPPAPLGGRRTLSPVHYAHAASDECPMLSTSGPVATWCQHHIQEHTTTTGNTCGSAGAAVPLGVVNVRHLWLFACSLLFAGATVSLVSAALAVVAWRLLHEPTGSDLARNASSAMMRAAAASVAAGGDTRLSNFTPFADHPSPAAGEARGNASASSQPFGCATPPPVAQDDVPLPVE
ncbi:uncharacterized protein LOC119461968 [Dermacentor silvarum]|uniref:uncharacterized protein LOC119461968 n=1 Tax=Dermacentor silvarum TaxID=543639 RepID=UPI00189A3330|nr:uncharacterized protein LOC119461968 [Dermacentor silvarum]